MRAMCHSRRLHRHPAPAADLGAPDATHARRDAALRASEAALRASDAERESVVAELREHACAGRLDVDELEQRIGAAYAARTRGDLAALVGDLPGRAPARRRARAPRVRAHEWTSFAAINVLLVAIWALSGGGHFWPAWVMLWWGFALVMKSGRGHALPGMSRSTITSKAAAIRSMSSPLTLHQ